MHYIVFFLMLTHLAYCSAIVKFIIDNIVNVVLLNKNEKTTPIKWKCTSVLVHFRRLFRFYFMWNAFLLFDRSVVFWELFVVCVEFWILFGHKFCRFDKLTAYYQFLIRQQDKRWNYFVCKIMHIYVLRLMCRSISWKHCKYGFFFLHKNLMISTWMKLNAFIAITQSVLFLSFFFSFGKRCDT